MAGRMRELSKVSFTKTLISFMRALPSWHNHLPKAPPPKTLHRNIEGHRYSLCSIWWCELSCEWGYDCLNYPLWGHLSLQRESISCFWQNYTPGCTSLEMITRSFVHYVGVKQTCKQEKDRPFVSKAPVLQFPLCLVYLKIMCFGSVSPFKNF